MPSRAASSTSEPSGSRPRARPRSSPTACSAAGVSARQAALHQRRGDPRAAAPSACRGRSAGRAGPAPPSRRSNDRRRRDGRPPAPRHDWCRAIVAGMPASAAAARPEVTPGNDAIADAGLGQRLTSSQPRPNTNGSPPFRRSTRRPARARSISTLVDVVLVRRRPAAALAGGDQLGAVARQRQHARIDQRVVDDLVRRRQRMQRQHGQQARIAGPGAGQPHFAGREVGHSAGSWRGSLSRHWPRPRKRRW